jgi:predicted TIM-barrel enzyme
VIRQQMEESGISYGQEVEMIRQAHLRGFLTTPYVFNPGEAAQMAAAGADIIVVHLGLTAGGRIGAQTRPSLDAAIQTCRVCADAALTVRPDVLVICHGGPIAEPEDALRVMQEVPQCVGFYGASSMERLPTERALLEQARKFVALRLPHVHASL